MTGLIVQHLSAGYRRRAVLRDLAIPDLPAGTLAAVVGPNAAGKSTLLRAIAGLLPSAGRLDFRGQTLATMKPAARARQVAYLPQSLPQATSLVVYEAVYAACRAVVPEWGDARTAAAIDAVLHRLGMQDLALRRLDELSGGQRQMVGLAQVLARDADLLLLDEPTSALDLRWQLDVLAAVREAVDGGAIALIALHDINLALQTADRVIVLAGGQVIAAGPPAEAITPEILRRAYGVDGRVERCSRGRPIVVVDGPTPRASETPC